MNKDASDKASEKKKSKKDKDEADDSSGKDAKWALGHGINVGGAAVPFLECCSKVASCPDVPGEEHAAYAAGA
eukprot:5876566-Alexandrium_andersonii.AAC.1